MHTYFNKIKPNLVCQALVGRLIEVTTMGNWNGEVAAQYRFNFPFFSTIISGHRLLAALRSMVATPGKSLVGRP